MDQADDQVQSGGLHFVACTWRNHRIAMDASRVHGVADVGMCRMSQDGHGYLDWPKAASRIPVVPMGQLIGDLLIARSRHPMQIVLVERADGLIGLVVEDLFEEFWVDPEACASLPPMARSERCAAIDGAIHLPDWLQHPSFDEEDLPIALRFGPRNWWQVQHDTDVHPVSVTQPSHGADRLVCFQPCDGADMHSGSQVGLAPDVIETVMRPRPIVSVPHAAKHFLGFSSWRGQPLPVFDLRACLELPGGRRWLDAEDPQSLLMIVRTQNQGRLAFHVRGTPQERSTVGMLPHASAVGQFLSNEHETIVVPDLDSLVSSAPQCART